MPRSEFQECPKCREYHFTHEDCAPNWRCWKEDEEKEDGSKINAQSADTAAEKYLEAINYDHDYTNDDILIYVESESKKVSKWRVSAEPTIDYTASQVDIDE